MLKRTWLFIALALSLVLVLPVTAAESPRIERTTINGMNILLQKTKAELVEVTLLLKSGSGLDPRGEKGTALIMNYFVSVIIRNGNPKLGDFNVETFPDYTLITVKTDSRGMIEALGQIKELLSYPLYSYDLITDLKGLLSMDLKAISALRKSYYRFGREFYGQDHPYNEEMDPEVVASISGNGIYKWYRQTYQPGNAILSISGGSNKSIAEIAKFFANMRSEAVDNRLLINPQSLNQDQRYQIPDPNGRVASITIGFPAPRIQDPEYPAFRVIAYYLEEYQHYFEELRVKDGLMYAGFVSYDYLEKPLAPNIIFLTMTDPSLLKSVERRTLEVVNQLADTGIPEADLAKVIKAMKAASAAQQAASKGLATRNALSHYLQNQLIYDDNLWPKLEQLKPEDIKKAAAKYFKHFIRVASIPEQMEDNF